MAESELHNLPIPATTVVYSITDVTEKAKPALSLNCMHQKPYTIVPAIVCSVMFFFGVMYAFYGYRLFKASMFLVGFMFGSLLTYLVCLEENFLSVDGKIGVALAAGLIIATFSLLIIYVGLFINGLQTGLLIGCGAILILEHIYSPTTKWIPVSTLFFCGLISALSCLYFQKSFTILGTSLLGSALICISIDYWLEQLLMLRRVWATIRMEAVSHACWYSWLVLMLWPTLTMLSVLVQGCSTAKGYHHKQESRFQRPRRPKTQKPVTPSEATAVELRPSAPSQGTADNVALYPEVSFAETIVPRRKTKNVNLEKIRARRQREMQHSRYRHLYRVRRSNGDVVSQEFMEQVNRNHLNHSDGTPENSL